MKYPLNYLVLALSLSLVACAPDNTPPNATTPSGNPSPVVSTQSPENTASPRPLPSPGSAKSPSISPSAMPTTNPQADVPPPPANNTDNAKVASIKFADGTNRFLTQQNQERQLNVVLLDANGNRVPQNQVQLDYLSSRSRDISISESGNVKALVGLGYSKITVRVAGTELESSINFDVTDPSFFSSSNSSNVQQPVILVPSITGLSINNGVSGQTLVITGTHFSQTLSQNTVKFGNRVATLVAVTPTTLTVKIPELTPGETSIVVTTNSQSSTAQKFTVDPLVNFVFNGENASDQSGYSVSGAGDVNGDGKDDIIIGAPFADPNGSNNGGRSYVIYGGSVTTPTFNLSDITNGDGSKGFTLNGGENGYDRAGFSVSRAGDVNGDGKDDLIIGADLVDSNGNDSGRSYVIYGGSVTTPTLNLSDITNGDGSKGFTLNGENGFDQSGVSVSRAGDVNGDGKDDLIIGAPFADPNASISSGKSYLVYGGAITTASFNLSTLNGTNGFVLNGEVADDVSGLSVSSAGDVNGDGKDDIIIGALSQARMETVRAAKAMLSTEGLLPQHPLT